MKQNSNGHACTTQSSRAPESHLVQMSEYTKDELVEMLDAMQRASSAFYARAVHIGCHPFIEFTGLMNEYIGICRDASEVGIDFPLASEHSGLPLPAKPHHMAYIAEKLRCIFGPALDANKDARDAFVTAMKLGKDKDS